MQFSSLSRFLSDQMDAANDAVLPLALAVVATAVLVWLLTRWRYRALIARLRADAPEAAGLDDGWRGSLGGGQAEIAVSADDPRTRQRALRKITNAIDAGALVAQTGDPREAETAMGTMEVALLAARTTFDLPIPTSGPSVAETLAVGRTLLELVRPALFEGQDEEARRSATEFLRREGVEERQPTRIGD